MNDADLSNMLTVMGLLVAPISMVISLIALNGYRRFRNWRLLFLSAAFMLLAVPPALGIMVHLGAGLGLSSWTISELHYSSFIFTTASVLPFALLTYVYFDERRTQSITITPPQWALGGLLLLAEAGFIIFILATSFLGSGLSSVFSIWEITYLLYFILASIAYVLIILIVISLFAYYRAKKKRNTLVVMMGFVCLLFSQGYGVFSYLVYSMSSHPTLASGLALSLQLAGYIAFLAALLRLKVFR